MERDLKEMSLEELWKLFPIMLQEHQPQWKLWYQEEAEIGRASCRERV